MQRTSSNIAQPLVMISASSSSTSQPIDHAIHAETNTRVQMRQRIKIILIRRLSMPPHTNNGIDAAQLRRRRNLLIKELALRIESSLYRRSLSMEWYADLRMLEWRVVRIAREMLMKNSERYERSETQLPES